MAIGTHDYSTIKGPFFYDAKPPQDIRFVPLNKGELGEMNATEVLTCYEKDSKLKQYLDIIKTSPVYPVIYDSNGVVLSLPPIINGDHSKIMSNTKDIFIEATATDLIRANMVLNALVSAFSYYCSDQFTIEEVEVIYEGSNPASSNYVTPNISSRNVEIELSYLNSLAGIQVDLSEACKLLQRCGFGALPSPSLPNVLIVEVPMQRADILHPCDLVEDIAIAYGYNNIKNAIPPSATVGKQIYLNKYTELIREEIAHAGYTECLNFALSSKEDLSKNINVQNPNLVTIHRPKSSECQAVRNTLIPGILRTLRNSKALPLPIYLFEVTDVVVLDPTTETGAKNERRLVAARMGHRSEFEVNHHLSRTILQWVSP